MDFCAERLERGVPYFSHVGDMHHVCASFHDDVVPNLTIFLSFFINSDEAWPGVPFLPITRSRRISSWKSGMAEEKLPNDPLRHDPNEPWPLSFMY